MPRVPIVPVRECKQIYFLGLFHTFKLFTKYSFLLKSWVWTYTVFLRFFPLSAHWRPKHFYDKVCYVSIDLRFLKGPDLKWQLNIPYIHYKARLKKRPHIALPKDAHIPELLTIICKSLQHSASPKPFSFPPQLLKKEKDSVKIVLKVALCIKYLRVCGCL